MYIFLPSIVAFLSYLIPLKESNFPTSSNQVQVALIDEMISTFRQGTSAYQQRHVIENRPKECIGTVFYYLYIHYFANS